MIKIKRIYDPYEKEDGYRVLVDRLWPRGLTKKKANVDEWLKEIAPSTPLRKWFGHDPKKWAAFQSKYKAELFSDPTHLDFLKKLKKNKTITLLYAAKDERHNHARVLQSLLESNT